jgi:hypothetical protein
MKLEFVHISTKGTVNSNLGQELQNMFFEPKPVASIKSLPWCDLPQINYSTVAVEILYQYYLKVCTTCITL